MRLSFRKLLGLSVSALILGFAVFHILTIRHSVQKTLADERARLKTQNRVEFEKKTLTPHLSQTVQILQNTADFKDFVKFENSYFAATGGGLVQFDGDGKITKHFTVLDGLPESDLTCLAVFAGKLVIGARTKNLLTFDGEKFVSYIWTDRQAQAVTSFLETDGKLLIGTQNGGLIEFDGVNFTELKAANKRLTAVNCLFKNGAELLVGTFDDGLYSYKNDVWTHYTNADGLPSNRVVGFAVKNKNLYAATDFGLAILEDKNFRTVAELPALSSLLAFHDQLFLTKNNGEIFTFDSSAKKFSVIEKSQSSHLITADNKLWLLTNQAVAEVGSGKIKPFSQVDSETLTDNFVSAIAFDGRQNLWVGTFRRGVDVFSAAGKKLTHLETENLREINYLQSNGETISAATSGGLVKFTNDFSAQNLTAKDGLPSNSINHFSGDFVATAKGLARRQNGQFRLISTVQNLPNNSVYTTLQVGNKLYAGTLGGLAEIENGRVIRTFKDSNSNLTTNWVTALCYANERLFIGTYGGGMFELLPSGGIRSFAAETGKFTVNVNALFSDGERLYAGTLDGVKVLDLNTQEWKKISKVLPSATVTSIAGTNANIYFGTTNGIARIEKSYFKSEVNE